MALTRARVVWASDPAFGERVATALEAILRRPRPGADVAGDVRRMRDLMMRERAGRGFWDLKLTAGGQVDCEFLAQYRQLIAAAAGGPLTASTLEALAHDPDAAEAWRMQQALNQILGAAFDDKPDPDAEPEGFRTRLAEAGGCADFERLKDRLAEVRARARAAFEAAAPAPADGN
jgi:glutamate-ammonia-ligase adenylyltransferase